MTTIKTQPQDDRSLEPSARAHKGTNGVKIYSWNMLYCNADFGRAYAFIENLDFDVLCLQEVPEHFLERLRALSLQIAHSIDSDRMRRKPLRTYCVILSKHPIERSWVCDFPDLPHPLRTRVFITLMRPAGWHLVKNRHGVYADIHIAGQSIRVFSLHLSLSHPEKRRLEFDTAMHALGPRLPTIVCGDFNILESPRVTLLNWLLGGSWQDIFAWTRERMHIEERFQELKLRNPLRGKQTQTISHSQLDHILISPQISLLRAGVNGDRCGSDHHPIFIECRV